MDGQLLDLGFGSPPPQQQQQQQQNQANQSSDFDPLAMFSNQPQQPPPSDPFAQAFPPQPAPQPAAQQPLPDIFSPPAPSSTPSAAVSPGNNDPWATSSSFSSATQQLVPSPASSNPFAVPESTPQQTNTAPASSDPWAAPSAQSPPPTAVATAASIPAATPAQQQEATSTSNNVPFTSDDPSAPSETANITSEVGDTDGPDIDQKFGDLRSTRDDDDRYIKDPLLIEVKHKFSGRWKLARSDPYDEFLKFIGVGLMTRKLANTSGLEQVIFVKDNAINIQLHSTFYNQLYRFRLNETQENLVNKVRQSVFCNYEKNKLLLQLTTAEIGFGKTSCEERFINDKEELVVIYTSSHKTCRRYFVRIPDLPIGPQV